MESHCERHDEEEEHDSEFAERGENISEHHNINSKEWQFSNE